MLPKVACAIRYQMRLKTVTGSMRFCRREIDDVHFRPQDGYAKYISGAVEYENVAFQRCGRN